MPRRTLLGAGALAATGAGLLGWRVTTAQDSHEEPHWTYEGEGPEHWGGACATGGQSPISLSAEGATDESLENVHVEYATLDHFRIENNGHTIKVWIDHESLASINGVAYGLKEFHFHAPSEHAFNNQREALEMHMVHRAVHNEDEIAVLGVLLRVGGHNESLAPVFENLPTAEEHELHVARQIAPASFLPDNPITFRYVGSLTTPPCTTGVQWIVFEQPVEISAHQAAAFTVRYTGNARPLQEPGDRKISEDTTP